MANEFVKKKSGEVKKSTIKKIIIIALIYVGVIVLVNSGILGYQYRNLLVSVSVNIIMAVSLNLVTGFLGELSLGHAGFMAVGAYTGSLITLHLDLPMWIEVIVGLAGAGIMAAIFGILIGIPVLRLHGDYLAIVTLAFGQIIASILNYAKSITGGASGLSNIPEYTTSKHYILVITLVILSVVIMSNIMKSRYGRAITAVRDNYIAAEATGVCIRNYKIFAFVVGAFFAGIAGFMFAHNVGIIKPNKFDFNMSINILVIVVLGGMGSIRGSIIAAIILTILPEMLRDIQDYRMLMYAVLLIAAMLFNNSKLRKRLVEDDTLKRIFKRKKKEA
ncbi:MAG: branched-chain amino acid ABC transporter permease [bacterium]|nr:branched-chain amino acid ABC transporter permease [bacterium]